MRNRRWPFRAQLLRDLAAVTVASTQAATETGDALLKSKARPSTTNALNAISRRERAPVKVKPSGLIVTSLISCPRLLKPHLLIEGEPVTLCDISSAHWMFLPRLVGDRIAFMVKRGDEPASIDALQTEMRRLIELCSSGSFYESTLPEGATPAEVKTRKHILNILLNSPTGRRSWQCSLASTALWIPALPRNYRQHQTRQSPRHQPPASALHRERNYSRAAGDASQKETATMRHRLSNCARARPRCCLSCYWCSDAR